jgi:CO/xanthine dehydrogenase Mo-binding subunit
MASAVVRLHPDGRAEVDVGAIELGQGAHVALARIAAQELGIPPECVSLAPVDTAHTPYNFATLASRTTTVVGLAVQAAARDARDQLERGDRDHLASGSDAIVGRGSCGPGTSHDFGRQRPLGWSLAVGAVALRVDPETGAIDVDRCVSLVDAGKAIYPAGVVGQVRGSVVMGFGSALFEELLFDSGSARLLTSSLGSYCLPRAGGIPAQLDVIVAEDGNGPGPSGARGVGEVALIPVAGAVAGALYWATRTLPTQLPLTPERVWRMLSTG